MPFKMKPFKYVLIVIICLIVLIGGFLFWKKMPPAEPALSYNDFITYAEQNKVTRVIAGENQNFLQVALADSEELHKVPNPAGGELFDFLVLQQIPLIYEDQTAAAQPVLLVLPAVLAAGWYFYRRKNRPALLHNANPNNKRRFSNPAKERLTLMLSDVAGNTEAKAMVADMISFIKNPDKYANVGARMPRGILFYGPPGTGKTLMAKAIAGEAGVPFYACSGSDFMQTYVGVGAGRIRELFQTAKKSSKAVVFIDEIDAIGKKRSKQPGAGHDERDQTLNALLTEMSGFHERDGVVVIAATNRLDTLDDALTRPGRFDRLIEIALPDVNARKKILALHAHGKPLDGSVDLEALAKSTVSFSGAMLENLLNEAAIFAANENKTLITGRHLDKAFFTVIAGAEKSDTGFISEQDRKVTAYHEAAHALITRLLLPDSYLSKVTIIPSTRGAGGFSLSIPKDTLYLTKRKLLANMKVLLAGRAGEELILGRENITTGAGNDIEKVSRQMVDYLHTYGMDDEFGIFNGNVLNDASAAALPELCRNKLNRLYEETKGELLKNISKLHLIAAALLEKESLNEEDIDRLLAQESWREKDTDWFLAKDSLNDEAIDRLPAQDSFNGTDVDRPAAKESFNSTDVDRLAVIASLNRADVDRPAAEAAV